MGFQEKYLTKEHLSGFENYKYNSVDTSPLSIYVMHPFWNHVVLFFPKWVAPNVLTFVGFLFTVLNFVLFSYYDYSFYASSEDSNYPPIPKWVFAVASVNIFLAYTLDGIDGKQARRTQTSGPLGELFDHGLDSFSAVLIPTALFSIFGRGAYSISPYRMYFIVWNIFMSFYLSHFEKYNTGVLFLPWGYDFSMWGSILLFLVTGIFGHEMWQFKVFNLRSGQICEACLYLTAVVSSVPVMIYNIYKSYRDRTGKMRSFPEAVRPLIPVAYLISLGTFWISYSPSNIVERDPRALYYLSGVIFSNICCRLIVSQMSNTRCELFNWLLYPTTTVVLLSVFILKVDTSIELYLLYALNILATVAHVHYGTRVVQQMCDHFHIKCFKIKARED